MKQIFQFLYLKILFVLIINACSHDPFDISVKNVKINTTFYNLDSALRVSSDSELLTLKSSFDTQKSEILNYNISYCLGLKMETDTSFTNGVKRFYQDDYIKRLTKTIEKKHLSYKPEKEILVNALKRLKVFFPKGNIPEKIYFINSYFSSSIFCTKNEIAIGVERYLGADEKVIQELPNQQFYTWIKNSFKKEYLARDVIAGWIMTHYCEETTKNIASEMIRWGKILYFTQATMPKEKLNIIARYSEKQYDWAIENEGKFWRYLVEKELLFKTDEKTKTNLMKEGPFTSGLPDDSPDRLGQFLGWRIIKQYMDNHKISLAELNKISYNEILQNYKAQ